MDHYTGKNNGFPFLDILGYLKNTHKNPKFGRVRQIPIREFPTKFPNWDLSHSSKFGIFVGTKISKNGNALFFSCELTLGNSSICPVQRPRGLSWSLEHLECPVLQNKQQAWKNCRKITNFRLAIWNDTELHTERTSLARKIRRNRRPEVFALESHFIYIPIGVRYSHRIWSINLLKEHAAVRKHCRLYFFSVKSWEQTLHGLFLLCSSRKAVMVKCCYCYPLPSSFGFFHFELFTGNFVAS